MTTNCFLWFSFFVISFLSFSTNANSSESLGIGKVSVLNSNFSLNEVESKYYSHINEIAIPVIIDNLQHNRIEDVVNKNILSEFASADIDKLNLNIKNVQSSNTQKLYAIKIKDTPFCFINRRTLEDQFYQINNKKFLLNGEFFITHEMEHCFFYFSNRNSTELNVDNNRGQSPYSILKNEMLADVSAAIYLSNSMNDELVFDRIESYRNIYLARKNDFVHWSTPAILKAKKMYLAGELNTVYKGDYRKMTIDIVNNVFNEYSNSEINCINRIFENRKKDGFQVSEFEITCKGVTSKDVIVALRKARNI